MDMDPSNPSYRSVGLHFYPLQYLFIVSQSNNNQCNVSYVVSLLTNNDFSKAKYAPIFYADFLARWPSTCNKISLILFFVWSYLFIFTFDVTLVVWGVTQFVLPLWPTSFLVYIIDLLPKNNNNNNNNNSSSQESLCVWQNMD